MSQPLPNDAPPSFGRPEAPRWVPAVAPAEPPAEGPGSGAAAGPDAGSGTGPDAGSGPDAASGRGPDAVAVDPDSDEAASAPARGALGATGRVFPALPEPAPLATHGPARVLALCNQKGGVGKTTSAINLGAALTEYGRRVLLVDFDPQGALSVGLGIPAQALDHTIYDALLEGMPIDDVITATRVPGLDLVPSNIGLSAAEMVLVSEVGREYALARALAPVLPRYDVVLIDCQPSLGLLTLNALTAADGVLIPLECEYFALRGVALLQQSIEKVTQRLNPRLQITGVLATMYDARTVHGRQVLARLVEAFGDRLFHTVIARTVKFPETTTAGEPITTYAPTSTGAAAYRTLAKEVLASSVISNT